MPIFFPHDDQHVLIFFIIDNHTTDTQKIATKLLNHLGKVNFVDHTLLEKVII